MTRFEHWTTRPTGCIWLPNGLDNLRDRREHSLEELAGAEELFRKFDIADFIRENEFVFFEGKNEYQFIGRRQISSDGVEQAEHEYLPMTNEYAKPTRFSTTPLCRLEYAHLNRGRIFTA